MLELQTEKLVEEIVAMYETELKLKVLVVFPALVDFVVYVYVIFPLY